MSNRAPVLGLALFDPEVIRFILLRFSGSSVVKLADFSPAQLLRELNLWALMGKINLV